MRSTNIIIYNIYKSTPKYERIKGDNNERHK